MSNENGASQVLANGLLGTNDVTFSGLIDSTASFDTVRLTTSLIGDGVQLDRLQYGATGTVVTPVPEPEIYAMMGIGLGVMGWVARRKKRKQAAV